MAITKTITKTLTKRHPFSSHFSFRFVINMAPKKGFQKGNLHASLKNANKVSRFPFDPTVAKKEQAYTKSRTSRRCSCYHPENCREIQDEYDRLGMNDRVGYSVYANQKKLILLMIDMQFINRS
jgi:hypothetical protein